jgi:hypothetical protein
MGLVTLLWVSWLGAGVGVVGCGLVGLWGKWGRGVVSGVIKRENGGGKD